jgi:hypothetical protein
MSMVKRRGKRPAKKFAEGGPVKSKFSDTDWLLSSLSPAYAISQLASGDAKLGDMGLMGLMNGRFSSNPAVDPNAELEAKKAALAGVAPPARAYRKGGAVKASRGNGQAKRGLTRGRVR